MSKMELLAPAGSIDILKTAVHAGADAVYIGGPAFSARAGAKNFTLEEMKEGIEYAHFYNRKVYVAVNTLVKTEEMKKLVRYLEQLAEMTPDAVIIQDIGIAKVCREYVPELPLHASTQVTATNRYSIQALKELGFRRVVVARELTIDEIATIVRTDPEMQIETFIHGAQCFSYSGQCLMSSVIGGRSGNRGQCAQPCRLPFQLHTRHLSAGKEGTLLSPKDLFGLTYLSDLAKAGVHTLKIEGRLKNRDYVFHTVQAYRAALDTLHDTKHAVGNAMKRLQQTFNREFSSGYLAGDLGQDLISLERHNNKGIPIGTVSEYNNKSRLLTIELEDQLRIGDGIYIENKEQDGFGFTVSEMLETRKIISSAEAGQQIQLPLSEWDVKERVSGQDQSNNRKARSRTKIPEGSVVYKSFDKKLSQEINEQDQPAKIGISFTIVATEGHPVSLKYKDVDHNSGEVQHEYIVQKALKHPVTKDSIAKQLDRLGNTPYTLTELSVEISPEVMIPSSVLNELRRLAVDACTAQRIHRQPYQVQENWQPDYASKQVETPILIAKLNDVSFIRGLSDEYKKIYFSGDVEQLAAAVEVAKELEEVEKVPVYAVLSSMIKEQQVDDARRRIAIAIEAGVAGFVVNQIGQRELILEMAPNLEIVFDVGMHVFNQVTYQVLQETNPEAINLSLELTRQQLKEFKKAGYVYIHGRYRLMISEHSLLAASGEENSTINNKPCYLKDRKGFELPTIENEFGQVEIYNAHVTSLITELSTLKKHKHQGYIVDVSRDFQTAALVKKTLSIYADAFVHVFHTEKHEQNEQTEQIEYNQEVRDEILQEKLEELQQKLSVNYKGYLTKGHWQRGVK